MKEPKDIHGSPFDHLKAQILASLPSDTSAIVRNTEITAPFSPSDLSRGQGIQAGTQM